MWGKNLRGKNHFTVYMAQILSGHLLFFKVYFGGQARISAVFALSLIFCDFRQKPVVATKYSFLSNMASGSPYLDATHKEKYFSQPSFHLGITM